MMLAHWVWTPDYPIDRGKKNIEKHQKTSKKPKKTSKNLKTIKQTSSFRVDCAHGPSSRAEASQPHWKTREEMKITRR